MLGWDDHLRNALGERLSDWGSRGVRSVEDNFDLFDCQSLLKRGRDLTWKLIYLHGTTIDEEPIELLSSLGSSVGLDESDRGNTTAGAVLVVGEHDTSNGACGLGEVFL